MQRGSVDAESETGSDTFHFRGKNITTATNSLDDLSIASVIFELAPEAADGNINGAVERSCLTATQQLQKHVPCEDTVGALQKRHQQIIFSTGEGDLCVVRICKATADRIKIPPGKTNDACIGSLSLFSGLNGTAQDGADAGKQLTRVERLGNVVIRTEFEADDPVCLVAHGCEHDDWNIVLGTQPACNFETAFARKHEIQYDKLIMTVGPRFAGFAAITGCRDTKVVAFEELGQEFPDFAIVIHDQQVRQCFHSAI